MDDNLNIPLDIMPLIEVKDKSEVLRKLLIEIIRTLKQHSKDIKQLQEN